MLRLREDAKFALRNGTVVDDFFYGASNWMSRGLQGGWNGDGTAISNCFGSDEAARAADVVSEIDEGIGPYPVDFPELSGDVRGGKAVFTHDAWRKLLDETFEELRKLAALKGGEYSGDTDRLLNFRRNGENLGLPMETVWAVYAGKHWDAIMQFIRDDREGKERQRLEGIEGRVDDLLVYLLLFKAMLTEKK